MTRRPVPATAPSPAPAPSDVSHPVRFAEFVRGARAAGRLVVQPRMGFGLPADMRAGLAATKAAAATTVGTVTVDSYTRVGAAAAARDALRDGTGLNGYPIATHDPATTRQVLAGIRDPGFPVQVRHGSAVPQAIFAALMAVGIDATEGGPVSYCLPYGRTPLDESIRNWERCCEAFAQLRDLGLEPHLETFGGCMLGQLCPPSQLVALSVLEALFFHQHGLRSVSVSYAQGSHPEQDREAVHALRRLCTELLPADWHVVVYAHMGMYPRTPAGATRLLGQAAELAVSTGSERLIVKTVAESVRIPTVAENVTALEHAGAVAASAARTPALGPAADNGSAMLADSQIYREAYAFVDAVLNTHPDIGKALSLAFKQGNLDIPYCVHPDNSGRSRSYLDDEGRIGWADIGSLPLGRLVERRRPRTVTSEDLLRALSFVQRKFDAMNPADPAEVQGARQR
ncbi:methylaspartate mutase [Streptomyces sp. NPDC058155]|uniref:methylaspartate mutase n=1 Tax=Streptomyces sp. NPDC058155 TaxID=3346359 RepID=UPI0036F0CB72